MTCEMKYKHSPGTYTDLHAATGIQTPGDARRYGGGRVDSSVIIGTCVPEYTISDDSTTPCRHVDGKSYTHLPLPSYRARSRRPPWSARARPGTKKHLFSETRACPSISAGCNMDGTACKLGRLVGASGAYASGS